jgi:DnaJ-class molecular chaperone
MQICFKCKGQGFIVKKNGDDITCPECGGTGSPNISADYWE